MNVIINLMLCSSVSVVLSVALYLLKRVTPFCKVNDKVREVIIGVIFGFAAIYATLKGVDVGGATSNARDAAPLCAGLIFGPYAGIIAGAIGGIHRWVAVYNGTAGAYSQVACSVSTFLAGVFAAGLRVFMFDNKRPRASIACVIAIVIEAFHLTMLLITHMDDGITSMAIIKILGVPMIFSNAIAVFLSALIVGILSKIIHHRDGWERTLISRVQSYLIIAIVIAYLLSTVFVYFLETFTQRSNAESLFRSNIADLETEIEQFMDGQFLDEVEALVIEYNAEGRSERKFTKYLEKYNIAEINIINTDGLITKSSEPSYVGFNMYDGGEQSNVFMTNLKYEGEYTEKFKKNSAHPNEIAYGRKYVALRANAMEYIQIGYNLEQFQTAIKAQIGNIVKNRRIGKDGFLMVADMRGKVLCDLSGHNATVLSYAGFPIKGIPNEQLFEEKIYGKDCICYSQDSNGYRVIAVLSKDEVYESRDMGVYVNSFMQIMCYWLLFMILFVLIKVLVVKDINKINKSLGLIAEGQMDERINITSSDEMKTLSAYINNAVTALEGYIEEANHRMEKDLTLAKNIQSSALPNVFPAYPSAKEFDIYATMNTAKEVGGDFYDFYMLDADKLVFLIADVSGKGVPAAMFMMRAKALIKNYMEAGRDVAEAFTKANESLCEGNEAGMFVTAWMGMLDLNTGLVKYANAGHNPPLVYSRETGKYEYLMGRAGFVLAGMDGVRYKTQEFTIKPGDRVYIYTDGVTEATDLNKELYGEDRLINYMNQNPEVSVYDLLTGILDDVNLFVGEAEQFDDITMVGVKYDGPGGEFHDDSWVKNLQPKE